MLGSKFQRDKRDVWCAAGSLCSSKILPVPYHVSFSVLSFSTNTFCFAQNTAASAHVRRVSLFLSLNLALVQKIQPADDLGFKIAAFKADVCRSAGSLCDSKAIHRVLMSHCLSLNEKYIYHWRRLYLLLSKLLPCFCSKSTQAKINSGIPDVWCPCLSP
jgi:hypothetical protein